MFTLFCALILCFYLPAHAKQNVKISRKKVVLAIGKSKKLKLNGVKKKNKIHWKSSDKNVVSVNKNGKIKTSANQTIALVEYFLSHYQIDTSKVYINGYSGDGETLSLVLGKRPELFTRALMCSSQWDGKYEPVVKARTPVYFVIGEDDEYYSSKPFKDAYQKLHELYRKQGLCEKQIEKLLVLDVKGSSYFQGTGITYQHAGGYLFSRDKEIMGWLFGK